MENYSLLYYFTKWTTEHVDESYASMQWPNEQSAFIPAQIDYYTEGIVEVAAVLLPWLYQKF